jgi:hypothetical protein
MVPRNVGTSACNVAMAGRNAHDAPVNWVVGSFCFSVFFFFFCALVCLRRVAANYTNLTRWKMAGRRGHELELGRLDPVTPQRIIPTELSTHGSQGRRGRGARRPPPSINVSVFDSDTLVGGSSTPGAGPSAPGAGPPPSDATFLEPDLPSPGAGSSLPAGGASFPAGACSGAGTSRRAPQPGGLPPQWRAPPLLYQQAPAAFYNTYYQFSHFHITINYNLPPGAAPPSRGAPRPRRRAPRLRCRAPR